MVLEAKHFGFALYKKNARSGIAHWIQKVYKRSERTRFKQACFTESQKKEIVRSTYIKVIISIYP